MLVDCLWHELPSEAHRRASRTVAGLERPGLELLSETLIETFRAPFHPDIAVY